MLFSKGVSSEVARGHGALFPALPYLWLTQIPRHNTDMCSAVLETMAELDAARAQSPETLGVASVQKPDVQGLSVVCVVASVGVSVCI